MDGQSQQVVIEGKAVLRFRTRMVAQEKVIETLLSAYDGIVFSLA